MHDHHGEVIVWAGLWCGLPIRGRNRGRGSRRHIWSALGPHYLGNRWSSVVTSGHDWYEGIAGRSLFLPLTSVA
jgi:hypothetical protein